MKFAATVFSITVFLAWSAQAQFKPDIEYGKAGENSLRLDATVPAGAGPFPIVILVHGGGWSSGDKKDMRFLADPLAESNFTTFSINYRLAPTNRWPACFEDVQTAIRWVKAHGAEYKGNPKRIGLIGYSAGGQLVCLAAVQAKEDTRVQAVVGCAAPTDMLADAQRRGGLSKSAQDLFNLPSALDSKAERVLREVSAVDYIKPGLPPFLFIHGTDDKSVPYKQSVIFKAKLETNSVPCELMTLKGMPHRISEWVKANPSWKKEVITWLERTLSR